MPQNTSPKQQYSVEDDHHQNHPEDITPYQPNYQHESQQQHQRGVSFSAHGRLGEPLILDDSDYSSSTFGELGNREGLDGQRREGEHEDFNHALGSSSSLKRRGTASKRYSLRFEADENEEEISVEGENELEVKKSILNTMFGIMPFAGHVTVRDLEERSEKVKSLYEQVSDLKPEQLKKPEKNRMISFGNIVYCLLFGWWLFITYILVGILSCLTLFCIPYGKKCFSMAFYYFWPFGKYIERIVPQTRIINTSEASSLISNDSTEVYYDHRKETGVRRFLKIVSMVIWCVFIAPLLFFTHCVSCVLSWLTVFGIPTTKVQFQGLKLLYKSFLELHVSDEFPPNVESDIMVCTYQAFNLYYYKYSLFGANVLLFNMLPLVPLSIVLGFAFGDEFVEKYGVGIFVCCILAVIPLSYYISKAVSSISAQSNYVVGAFLNASFGSVVEIILYFATLYKGMSSIVMQAVTGSFLGDTLLIPGLSMIFGGFRHRVQYFNRHAAGTSSLLLLVATVGCFVPSLFYTIYGNYELSCLSCIDLAILHNITTNGTSYVPPSARNNTRNGTLPYQLACQNCIYVEKDFTQDPIYQHKAKPLALTTAAILPLAYLVGLIFSLKTHNKYYLTAPKVDEEDNDANGKAPSGHGAAEWPRWVCVLILLIATVAFAFVAEAMTKSLEPAFEPLGIPLEFAGLTVFALVPNISEIVSAIKFALQNNVTLSLEIGNVAGIQTALIQIPALVIFSTIIFQDDITKVFSLTFPRLDLVAIFFAVIILNYVTIDGKSNYFHGFSLLVVYVIIVISFFFAYF